MEIKWLDPDKRIPAPHPCVCGAHFLARREDIGTWYLQRNIWSRNHDGLPAFEPLLKCPVCAGADQMWADGYHSILDLAEELLDDEKPELTGGAESFVRRVIEAMNQCSVPCVYGGYVTPPFGHVADIMKRAQELRRRICILNTIAAL